MMRFTPLSWLVGTIGGLLVSLLPTVVHGQEMGPLQDPSKLEAIPQIPSGDITTIITAIGTIVGWMLALAGALAVAYLVWGGIQYITGGADGSKAAKGTIINAIVGVIIIILARVIVGTVVNLLVAK